MIEIRTIKDTAGNTHVTSIPKSWAYNPGYKLLRMLFDEEGQHYLIEGEAHIIPAAGETAWIATMGEKSYLLSKESERKFKNPSVSPRKQRLAAIAAAK